MDKDLNKKEKKSLIRRLLVFVFTIVFFLTIVMVYYFKLYSETEENILNTGRINAIESTNQINGHVSSSIGFLRMCSYMLDSMIESGKPKQEIVGYLTGLSAAIKNSLIPNSTGLYGYINGEYMDGIGWEPGDDYDPKERPWYKAAVEGKGELVIVDPYVDKYSGKSMLSVVRLLGDGKSVVGLDLTVDELQSIMHEHVAEKGIFEEFIVNTRSIVIAHSDQTLIGTDYSNDANPLGKLIAEGRKNSEDNFFYLNYDGSTYLVYFEPLVFGWTCVTVIDATNEYANLRIPIIICVLTALIVISVMAFFLMQSDKKSREAYEMAIISEKATATSDAKSKFLSNMSHEIRTPINAILGMNEMILRESDDETIIQYAENLQNAGRTLLGLINDILDFSKIEAGKIEINPVNYDLSVLLNDLVNMIAPRAEEKGLKLILDFDKDMPVSLNGDEIRIKQIITNILTNAVKYTKKGSVTFKTGYERIENEPDSVMLNVSVTDTGIGIKEEDIKKIFIEFERIEEKRNRNIEGTGLGMTITKRLLETMDSSLNVESTYGKGSTFSFSLKQRVVSWSKPENHTSEDQKNNDQTKIYKEKLYAPDTSILVVDDISLNLTVFKSLLKKTGIKIDTAKSGDESIAMASKKAYDIIFMDHMMPGKDGIEAFHEIRSTQGSPNLKTPVICITANAISGAHEQYLAEGFNDYLSKPIVFDELEEMLVRFLPEDKVQVVKEEA